MSEHAEEHETLEAGGADTIADEPVPRDIGRVLDEGLGPGRPKRVAVIGAGMAGLASALELKRAGHEVMVLEAQNRVGGRISTCRDFAPGLYAEFGAMRLPRSHELTLSYCDRFGLELRPFVMGNPKGLVHIGGQRMTIEEAGSVLDGAVFAFVEGTDPEVILLIEARRQDDGYQWQYACARFSDFRLSVRYRDAEVWRVPRAAPGDRTNPHFYLAVERRQPPGPANDDVH
jgi:phytoene dehydrogenase-like protein